ncbi:TetR family transcriptional regulator [Corynebacterium gerontici]|nr:TetR family transcriptional regulator [Corynebacterium gerontici]
MSTESHTDPTGSHSDPTLSHREAKRIRTHRAIEAAATQQVLERGFHEVTVDEICAPVGISRRTFFNYFNSKEEAVLGTGHRELSEEEVQAFCSQQHANLPASTLSLLVSLILDPNRDSLFDAATEARRKSICEQEPAFIRHQIARFHGAREAVTEAVSEYFAHFPQARRTQESAEDEARALTGVVFSAVMSAMQSAKHSGNLTPAHLRATSSRMLQATIDLLQA